MKRGVSRKMGNWTIRVLADWGLSKIGPTKRSRQRRRG